LVISKAKQIEYRRNQVAELLIEARTQQEIANVLGVSQQTIALDVAFLEKRAKEETKVLVEKKLPLAHLNAKHSKLKGLLNSISIAGSDNPLVEVEYKGKQSNVILTTQGESTLKIFGE